jgi:hypothetical protein
MPAYADQADFEAYVEGAVVTDPAALARLLERASRDVDSVMGPRPALGSGTYAGFKFDPDALSEQDRAALADATCAQAEYRDAVGEQQFAAYGVGGRISGPDFSYDAPSSGAGGTPRIGPKVAQEVMRINHLRTLAAYPRSGGWSGV